MKLGNCQGSFIHKLIESTDGFLAEALKAIAALVERYVKSNHSANLVLTSGIPFSHRRKAARGRWNICGIHLLKDAWKPVSKTTEDHDHAWPHLILN